MKPESERFPFFDEDSSSGSRRTARRAQAQRRRRTAVLSVSLVLFVAVIGVGGYQLLGPRLGWGGDYPGPGTGEVHFTVPDASTARSLAADLKKEDIVRSEGAFLSALSQENSASKLRPGEFVLKRQMKAADVVAVLLEPGRQNIRYVAVAQNSWKDDAFEEIVKGAGVSLEDIRAAEQAILAPQGNVRKEIGLADKAQSLEGYLAPGEYRFDYTQWDGKTGKEKSIIVLREMISKRIQEFKNLGVEDPAEQYRLLSVASILESEAGFRYYRAMAGVIKNRLDAGAGGLTSGRLESDATLAYGLKRKFGHSFSQEEKGDSSNPYNTFANRGLPPGPIGSPSENAVRAAKDPESNDYFFWVTVNLDTGETIFSKTFDEHKVNVEKYVSWCKENPGRCS